jgi:hypothetical protein
MSDGGLRSEVDLVGEDVADRRDRAAVEVVRELPHVPV